VLPGKALGYCVRDVISFSGTSLWMVNSIFYDINQFQFSKPNTFIVYIVH